MSAVEKMDLSQNTLSGGVVELLSGTFPCLASLFVERNGLTGSIPDGIASLSSIRRTQCHRNAELAGSVPEGFRFLQVLNELALGWNKFTGSLPEALLVSKDLDILHVSMNKIGGSLPQSLGGVSKLSMLYSSGNQLRSSLPGQPLRLVRLFLASNALTGSLPPTITCMRALQVMDIQKNALTGTLFKGITGVRQMVLRQNWLSGSIAEGLIRNNLGLQDLWLDVNWLSGSLPDAISSMQAIEHISLNNNELAGSIPMLASSLRPLQLDYNRLRSALPEVREEAVSMRVFSLRHNLLTGIIPMHIGCMSALERFRLSFNYVAGTFPEHVASFAKLSSLTLDANLLSGTLPTELHMLRTLGLFDCEGNAFEGTLTKHLGMLTHLKHLELSGARERPHLAHLRGFLPVGLTRVTTLRTVLVSRQRLEGRISGFVTSLLVLSLQENAFNSVLPLRLELDALVFLHRNHLSCRLPAGNVTQVKIALVALGNRFTRPLKEDMPTWVSPLERNSLFWCERNAGLWVAGRVLVGCGLLAIAIAIRIGCQQLVQLSVRWHVVAGIHGLFARQSEALLCFIASQALGGCILLLQVLACSYYICPSATAQGSACLLQGSFFMEVMVIVLWGRFCLMTQHPFFASRKHRRARRGRVGWKIMMRYWLLSTCWSFLVIALSCLVIIDTAAKCVPSFLRLGGIWTTFVDSGCGLFQGLICGLLLPSLSGAVSKRTMVRKPVLMSVATLLNTALIPALVVLHLSGACMDGWKSWWSPCTTETYNFRIRFDIDEYEQRVGLRPEDVCDPTRHATSVASCVRGIGLKLQEVILGKLATTAFVLPPGRLAMGRFHRSVDMVVVKLALLLELGMLFGPALPLIVPLLYAGVLTERLFAAVAWDKGVMKAVFRLGDVRLAVTTTLASSFVFYACFTSENGLAFVIFFFEVVMLVAAHLMQVCAPKDGEIKAYQVNTGQFDS